MPLKRADFCDLIPHAGDMCLLDEVVDWDDDSVYCLSNSHRSPDNPLREDGVLRALHAVEYAAQAMAVHGGLLAQREGKKLASGFIVALRDIDLSMETLDLLEAPLKIKAEQLFADGGNLMYRFSVDCAGAPVAEGRVTVVKQPEENP